MGVSLDARILSRRTTLQLAVMALMAGGSAGTLRSMTKQASAPGTWNWGGNAGHTGEFPGPGLDVSSSLGELWRKPSEEFFGGDSYRFSIVGYVQGILYTTDGVSLSARRLLDGELVWSHSPSTLRATPAASPAASPAATPAANAAPQADAASLSFSSEIAIDNGVLMVTDSDGGFWGLDAATGEFRWEISGAAAFYPPTVVDHVAYLDPAGGGVAAYELTNPPILRWQTETVSSLLGVEGGFVYVSTSDDIRALNVDDGSDFWRVSLGEFGAVLQMNGVTQDGIALLTRDNASDYESLVMIDRNGEVAWSRGGYDDSGYGWIVDGTITRITESASGYDTYRFESLFAANGALNWELDVNTARWPDASDDPVVCDGKAYALIRDADQEIRVLVCIDPVNGDVVGVQDSHIVPLFIADGVMVGRDRETEEIVAIGPVPAVLQAGGRASLVQDATLRGAPGDRAIERGPVASGSLVEVTGDSETSAGTEWAPVTVEDTGDSGWLPTNVLSGLDGAIRFEAIDPFAFGMFTAYPMFSSGTKAEITAPVALQGAPSASSVQKATLEAGTLVTVSSPPAETDEGTWCSIIVDATGESGWVPVSALTLAPGA